MFRVQSRVGWLSANAKCHLVRQARISQPHRYVLPVASQVRYEATSSLGTMGYEYKPIKRLLVANRGKESYKRSHIFTAMLINALIRICFPGS